MDATVSEYLQEEYRLLGQQTMPRPRTEAEYNHAHASATLPCNKTKNRYTDVLPVEATRIKLAPRADEPGSDYINANQVVDPTPPSHGDTNHYICAQAPLQNTLNDFWRMVWEQEVCMIVVLMRLAENGKVKGHRYWPKRSKRILQFSDITVTLVKGKHFPHRTDELHDAKRDQTTIRVLELKRGSERRNIVQLHFKDWPDFGVPESTEPIRNLVKIMDFYRTRARVAGINGPVVIHCSAGIGRTGTYLAIVFALSAIKHIKEVEGSASGAKSTVESAFPESESPSYSDDESSPKQADTFLQMTPTSSDFGSTTDGGGSIPATPTSPMVLRNRTSLPSSPVQPSFHHRRIPSGGSTGSVEYETTLLDDGDDEDEDDDDDDDENSEDEEDEEESVSESDPEDEENDMMQIRSYHRAGAIPVNIMKIVLSLRKQRNRGMVQTEDQYKFIYRVVMDEIASQKLNVSDHVMQFMTDAASDFTDAPLSARLSNSRRKSQPRSPRSTQVSLGSSINIGASGMSRLSSSTMSATSTNSFSDDENDRKAARLRSSGDSTSSPLLTLDSSEPVIFASKRNLAMSSANIQASDMGLPLASLSQSPTSAQFLSAGSPPSHFQLEPPAPRSPNFRRSSPPGTGVSFHTDM